MPKYSTISRRQLISLVFATGAPAVLSAAPTTMTVEQVRAAALAGDVLLIDIRTPAEWRASGVADVAHPLSMIDRRFGQKLVALVEANPGTRMALICALGTRSRRLIRLLDQRGYSDTVDVPSGMHGKPDGWLAKGLPTVPWTPAK